MVLSDGEEKSASENISHRVYMCTGGADGRLRVQKESAPVSSQPSLTESKVGVSLTCTSYKTAEMIPWPV